MKLCGSGELLLEKHGTKTRRSWRKLHIAVDADTGQIAAAALTTSDVDDASQVGALLDQVDSPVASFTADGAYDQDGVYREVAARGSEASVIVPPRIGAVPSDTAPTMRDRHLQIIAERGRMAWQKASGYNWRALVEAYSSRFKRIIGDRATIPHQSASSNRGRDCRKRIEPHARTRASGLRPTFVTTERTCWQPAPIS